MTIIKYTVGVVSGKTGGEGRGTTNVRLVVYDLLGREAAVLVNEQKQPGNYSVRFDGSGLASGSYFYRLTAGSLVETKKLVLLK